MARRATVPADPPMLAQRPDQIFNFTRRDFARLVVAAILLVVALSTILGVDVAPSGLGLQVGTIAQDSVRAPRALTYTSDILTARARSDAADGVAPQYDFSPQRAADVADAAGGGIRGGSPRRRRRVCLEPERPQPLEPAGDRDPGPVECQHDRPWPASSPAAGRSSATKRRASSTRSSGPSCVTPTSPPSASSSAAASRPGSPRTSAPSPSSSSARSSSPTRPTATPSPRPRGRVPRLVWLP